MAAFDFKKLTPHLIVIGLFALIAFLYNFPALKGMVLNQHDHISWQAMSKEARDYYEKTGEDAMWSNSMFGGMPTFTTYNAKTNNITTPLVSLVEKIMVKPAYFFFIAMLCFYILLVSLRCNRWVAAIGAFAYAFATYNPIIVAAGHETKMLAIGFLPGVLAGFILIFRGRLTAGAALLALFIALLFSTNHFQIAYYTFMILGAAWIGFLIQNVQQGKLKQFGIATAVAVLALLIGLAPNMAAILSTKDYDQYSMRSGKSELTKNDKTNKGNGGLDKEYAFQWSNGVTEVLTCLVPNLYGGGSQEDVGTGSHFFEKLVAMGVPENSAEQYASHAPTYWGDQPFVSGPAYFGAIICFLFVLAMLALRSPYKWWMLALAVLALLMSMGKNLPALNYFLFDHLPFLNKFRTPTMIMVIAEFLFAFSGMWMLNEVFKGAYDKEQLLKKVKIAIGTTAGLALLLAFGGSLFFDFKGTGDADLLKQLTQSGAPEATAQGVIEGLRADRQHMAMMSGIRSALFIAAAAALIYFYLNNRVTMKNALIGFGLLMAFDLLPEAHKYLNNNNYIDKDEYESVFALSPTDQQILQDKDPFYRVFDVTRNTYNDAIPAYHHHLVGGYHPAKMEIYQDLIENQMNVSTGKINSAVMNMLNTKYFVFPGGNGQPALQQNQNALGNGWFVNQIKWVNTADEEMAALNAPILGDTTQMTGAFNPAETAIVRKKFDKQLGQFTPVKDSNATIVLTQYGLNDMHYKTQNSGDGLAVFSDIYYPGGWQVYIDGKPGEIVCANYVLRAVKVPAGNHEVVFKFEPKSYQNGMRIAGIGSILLLLLIGVALFLYYKKGDVENETLAPVINSNDDDAYHKTESNKETSKIAAKSYKSKKKGR